MGLQNEVIIENWRDVSGKKNFDHRNLIWNRKNLNLGFRRESLGYVLAVQYQLIPISYWHVSICHTKSFNCAKSAINFGSLTEIFDETDTMVSLAYFYIFRKESGLRVMCKRTSTTSHEKQFTSKLSSHV